MTPTEFTVLRGVADATAVLEAIAERWRIDPSAVPYGREAVPFRLAMSDLRTIGVKIEPYKWLDQYGDGARQAVSRALRSLESAGLIIRAAANGTERLTHARLTTAGAAELQRRKGAKTTADHPQRS